MAEHEAARLGRMVDGAGRLGQSAGGVAMRVEDAGALLRDAAAFCEPVCQRRSNRVVVKCPPGLVVRCDRDLVLQALYNLVVNASRHCDEPATDDAGQGRDGGGRDLPTTGDPSAGVVAAALALLAASGTLLVSAGSMMLRRDEGAEDS